MTKPEPAAQPANPINAAIRELERICQEHQSRRAALAYELDIERAEKEKAHAALKTALAEVEDLKNQVAALKSPPPSNVTIEG